MKIILREREIMQEIKQLVPVQTSEIGLGEAIFGKASKREHRNHLGHFLNVKKGKRGHRVKLISFLLVYIC